MDLFFILKCLKRIAIHAAIRFYFILSLYCCSSFYIFQIPLQNNKHNVLELLPASSLLPFHHNDVDSDHMLFGYVTFHSQGPAAEWQKAVTSYMDASDCGTNLQKEQAPLTYQQT